MIIIGICGASGSGKTTLSVELKNALGDDAIIIKQDAYYKDFPELSFEERSKLNFDEPEIFDHELLRKDINDLLEGKSIQEKRYDFTLHRRSDKGNILNPTNIVIVEGIHAFYDKELRDKMYLKLYIKVEEDICLLRRIERDIKERGRSIDSISSQYLKTVKPMYNKYIKNYVDYADVIIANGGKNSRIVNILAGYVRDTISI